MYKIGIGYDSHKIDKNEKLFLGGVNINCSFGLKGHSDADVLIHAVIDALLGACSLPDIGKLFPDTDEEFKDISSLNLLERVKKKITKDFNIINIDSVIIAEVPKIAPYSEKMKQNIADVLEIETNNINIKAKSNEGMGFIGRKEGIASIVNALVREKKC
ncbi:MAG: 2-C-methyl-D-erythritol 2,4-cyclodiphosphate synthase [Candidatus Mcinerneyibacterium aminivorans]|uniref:2-C-methyl-D-erythritol 2,4-cyclodiphosphate synthase n=1 Tax=Candidatus Mcinerneyibacterium aminivorans TaxID=2703815 RepID=A0A5D0MF06_9BACT|nr:MAG: 2-C-methyl-D-erythritol 2,4-cyclodiphosphate synthase [Candidatus Mcinerneyibacterium aminivorans]